MKKLIYSATLLLSSLAFSQVGINTENPQATFHIDGKSSTQTTNPTTGAPTAEQQKDDVVITNQGRVGIGTIAPSEKLEVNGKTKIIDLPENGNDGFTATRTVVADANGVLGYVNGLPSTGGTGTPPPGSIGIGETISAIYSVPVAIASAPGWRLGEYVTANGLTPLPLLDGLQMDVLGQSWRYYAPIIVNASSAPMLISFQSFATQVNQNKTLLNQNLLPCPFDATTFSSHLYNGNAAAGWLAVDNDALIYWQNNAAEVEITNLQVQVDANTYRWYEFKWWGMEVEGEKKIFLSATRKA